MTSGFCPPHAIAGAECFRLGPWESLFQRPPSSVGRQKTGGMQKTGGKRDRVSPIPKSPCPVFRLSRFPPSNEPAKEQRKLSNRTNRFYLLIRVVAAAERTGTRNGDGVKYRGEPSLQQTASAMLVPESSPALSPAAAAEPGVRGRGVPS
jgi:hypothetical protein